MENLQYLYRSARLEDLEKLCVIFTRYRQFYGCESNYEKVRSFLQQRLSNLDSQIFICTNDEYQILGFVQLYYTLSSLRMNKAVILNDLYIEQAYRQQGIARQLIELSIKFSKQQGASYLELETDHDNFKAQALYKKSGLKQQDVLIFSVDC